MNMNYPKSSTFDVATVQSKIMGPNPLKLCEELLAGAGVAGGVGANVDSVGAPVVAGIPQGARVCDLGSGMGITSVLLSREYGFDTYAVDLWSDPDENCEFFRQMGVPDNRIHPVQADATQGLPFDQGFFDAVVSIDSYNYYGRDPEYLGAKLLPYVKPGGMIYLAIPGMVRDCHDNLPACLLESWTPEQMDYLHDIDWWRAMIAPTAGVEIVDVHLMEGTAEAWADWLTCENEYAVGDRASIAAGALEYLSTIAIVLRKE